MTTKTPKTSIFATDNMSAEDVAELLKVALPLMEESGRVKWAQVEADTGIGYSRGWLIVRRAWIELNRPELLVDYAGAVAAAKAAAEKANKLGDYDEERQVLAPIVEKARDLDKLSWGEIAVRLGLPESKVRKGYRAMGAKKDKGLRIGKGGRFAYDDGVLYRANRQKEGAHIPADLKQHPKETDLLNYVPETPVVKKAAPKAAKTKVA